MLFDKSSVNSFSYELNSLSTMLFGTQFVF
jgi:hypothetical protein